MRLTPSERDRLLLFTAAQLARARRSRGLLLNVPEATALIADTVAEAARDGARLRDAAHAGRSVLRIDEILPGVADIVTEVKIEAVFDDGTRLVVVRDPFQLEGSSIEGSPTSGVESVKHHLVPGEIVAADVDVQEPHDLVELLATNRSTVPISITSHFHFFEVNPRLEFDRSAAYGMRLFIPAGTAQRFDPEQPTYVRLVPIGGDRIAIGFAGLVDGPLDAPGTKLAALRRAIEQGYLGAEA
jgi:urease subunit gamma/beta